jgi:hypothetical protein
MELQKAKCEMVERDEIGKVLNEQALQAGLNRAESQRIGQILKADGLVLLSTVTNDVVSIRLVAVAPGVMVWFADFDTKKGTTVCSKMLATTITSFLPKLAVKKSDALPVSLLQIRPALETAHASILGRDLNRLLQLRLVREPSLFVLERENLLQMDEERRWAGQASEFWAGSYLLEGTVTHDVAQTNQVTLTLLIRPPGPGKEIPGTTIEGKGRSDQLPELVDQIAIRTCAVFGAQRQAPAWDPLTEGRAFYESAMQFTRRPVQRRIALESAMALGYRDIKVAAAYRETLGQSVFGWGMYGTYMYGTYGVEVPNTEQLRQAAMRAAEMLAFCSDYQPPGGFTPAEESQWLYDSVVADTSVWFQVGSFLHQIHKDRRQAELGTLLDQVQVEGCRLGAKVFNEKHREMARQNYRTVWYARVFYGTAAEIERIHRLMFLPKPEAKAAKIGPIRPDAFDPLFETSTTESEIVRQELLKVFLKQLPNRYDATSEDVRVEISTRGSTPHAWKSMAEQYRRATTAQERLQWRRKIQESISRYSGSIPSRLSQDGQREWFQYIELAFRLSPEVPPATSSDADFACRSFCWVIGSPTADNTLVRDWAGPLLFEPYLPLYSEEDIWIVVGAIDECERQRRTEMSSQRLDLAPYRQALLKRSPKIAQMYSQLFQVKHQITLPPGRAAGMFEHVGWVSDPFRWNNKRAWFFWGGSIWALHAETHIVEHVDKLVIRSGVDSSWRLDVTDSYLLMAIVRKRRQREDPDLSELWFRTKTEKEWRQAKFPFRITAVTEVNGRLYAICNIVSTLHAGIVEINPITAQATTVFDVLGKADQNTPEAALLRLDAVSRLLPNRDELLVQCSVSNLCAWSPGAKTWRTISQDIWDTADTEWLAYRSASATFGFELVDISLGSAATNTALPCLVVRRNGETGTDSIPLLASGVPPLRFFKMLHLHNNPASPDRRERDTSIKRRVILTAKSILLPFDAECGFWEIPYADIQKWLTANPLSAVVTNALVTPTPKGK